MKLEDEVEELFIKNFAETKPTQRITCCNFLHWWVALSQILVFFYLHFFFVSFDC